MSNWLDEFANSKIAQRVVLANYMSHLRLKNEGRETYANVEEALQDFAQRTGLTEMQKRALRRQVFIKIAAGLSPDLKQDVKQFDNGNAPAAILPGVKPGSDKAKQLDKLRKKPFSKLTDLGPESQQNRDIEDNAQQKSPGSPDTDAIVDSPSQTAEFRPGLVIEAAEDDPWAAMRKEEKPKFQWTGTKPQKGQHGLGISKEKRILEQIRELQTQIVKRFMEPPGTWSQPKWKPQSNTEKKLRMDLTSNINELRAELADIRFKRKLKEQTEAPKNKAAMNDIKFRVIVNGLLGAKTDEQRKEGLRKLSPEGLQDLYDRAIVELGNNIYYKPSQAFDKEHGDHVKCMVCDKHGKLWINSDNPGIIPFSHLETHADELLGEVDLTSTEAGKYHQEIVNAYTRRYPGAALQSRAHELANYMERLAEQATDKPLLHLPHVATKSERNLNYTDSVVIDKILREFRKFGVDPDDRTLEELAQETLGEIKGRLNEEFPGSLARPDEETEKEYKLRNIGRLEEKGIPFEAFHRAYREEVGRFVEEYRGTFSDFKPSTRRQKRRWTSRERQEVREERFQQLRVDDIEQQLAVELGHWPKPAELAKKLHDLSLIKIGISITGGRGCWNCGNNELVLVENKRIAINSTTCPKCGVYREVLVRVRETDWEQDYVIRDTNEADPGGPKHYMIWEDSDYIGNGPKSFGNCRFVHILGREEKEIKTRLVEPAPTPTGAPGQEVEMPKLEVGTPIYSQRYGHGRIVFIEDNHVWVAWEDPKHQRTAKLGALRGEVIGIASSDPNKSGNWKVIDVEVDEANTTITLKMKSSSGREATRYWTNLGVLEQDVQVAVEVDPQELQKVEYGSRRVRREKMLRRLGQEKSMRYVDITIDRYVKTNKPSAIVSRVEMLKKKIRRARLLKRLLRGVN
jgi:hypothetical protein